MTIIIIRDSWRISKFFRAYLLNEGLRFNSKSSSSNSWDLFFNYSTINIDEEVKAKKKKGQKNSSGVQRPAESFPKEEKTKKKQKKNKRRTRNLIGPMGCKRTTPTPALRSKFGPAPVCVFQAAAAGYFRRRRRLASALSLSLSLSCVQLPPFRFFVNFRTGRTRRTLSRSMAFFFFFFLF